MRPTMDEWGLELARVVALRSTCRRRAVGCVLVDARGRVLATGYAGVASGRPHCVDDAPCPGAAAESGTRLEECYAIHAEANALLQCRDVDAVATCYVTTSPCVSCVRLLLGAVGCYRVVAASAYAHDTASRALWASSGRQWHILSM